MYIVTYTIKKEVHQIRVNGDYAKALIVKKTLRQRGYQVSHITEYIAKEYWL